MEKTLIIGQLNLLAQLAALHGEDAFRLRAYERAAMALVRVPAETLAQPIRDWPEIEGVGTRIRAALASAADTGTLPRLAALQAQTPAGLLELLRMRGLSPGRLGKIWRTLHISSAEALEEACRAHKIAQLKGFGEKTEARILEVLTFYSAHRGHLRWGDALQIAQRLEKALQNTEKRLRLLRTGTLCRGAETLPYLEWIAITDKTTLKKALKQISECSYASNTSSPWTLRATLKSKGTILIFYLSQDENSAQKRHFLSSSSAAHLSLTDPAGHTLYSLAHQQDPIDEKTLYATSELPWIPFPLREAGWDREHLRPEILKGLLQPQDIKGVLHCHSHYSDGKDSLEAMAKYAQQLGYQYLGISDHSRSAFYANGLQAEDIHQQHEEIDTLNEKMAPFRIFKGIECDILQDGSLDYPDELLARFDFVIASIHSQLQMDQQQATTRLLRAIAHPYTQILGHISGRLLLERPPYALDYEAVLAACAQHKVAIEVNANTYRLDLSWHWIPAAQAAKIPLSLNPDAHDLRSIEDMLCAIPIAQKGGLQQNMTLNTYSKEDLTAYFSAKRQETAS